MTPACRAACGALAMLIAGLPFGMLLSDRGRFASGAIQAVDAAAALHGITVSLLPGDATLSALDGAQSRALNSGQLADQTRMSSMSSSMAPALPAASPGEGIEASDAPAYLPASQLTEWPRQRATDLPLADDEGKIDDVSMSAAWRMPKTVEAVLMIDEHGEVNRVQLKGDALEPPERQWLDQRLRAMRFVPGYLYGRPVRSRLAIELVLH